MTDFLCRLAAASLLAVAGGLPLVAPPGRPRLADLAAAWTLALGNAALLALAAGLAGWTLAPWTLALLLIAPGLAVALLTKVRTALAEAATPADTAAPLPDPPARLGMGAVDVVDAVEGAVERRPVVASVVSRPAASGSSVSQPPSIRFAALPLHAASISPATSASPIASVASVTAIGLGVARAAGAAPSSSSASVADAAARVWDSAAAWLRRFRVGRLARLGSLPGLALAVAAMLAAAKLAAVPLWSWDHFAVWGVKARTMMPGGHLRLGFLGSLYQSRADHPLGLPMAWLILTLGKAPDPMTFKALHAVFAAVLAVLLQAAVARITSSREIGCAAAAVLVISPLFWDSEAVGLAELPLALWAVAAVYLLIRGPASPVRLPWASGLALGFLPWIKQEGLPLALLALAFCCLAIARPTSRRTAESPAERANRGAAPPLARWLALGAPAVLLLVGAWAVQRWALPPGASFFAGAWCRRGIARLPELGSILRHCATDLLQPDWLGFWALLAAATFSAALRRRMRALALAAVVWCQVAVYMLTALFSYIAPHDHLNAAFFRICAPLMPLGLMAIAMALAPPAPAEAGPASEGLL
jgi:hypothetical protein